MTDSWVMESHDISRVGRAPNITFRMNTDRSRVLGEAPGARITLEPITEDARTVRISLFDANTLEQTAWVDIRQLHVPSWGEDWQNGLAQSTQLAAVLYWGQWRKQQLDSMGERQAEPAEVSDQQAYEFYRVLMSFGQEVEAEGTFEDFLAETGDGLPVFKGAIAAAFAAIDLPASTSTQSAADARREVTAHKASEANRIVRLLRFHAIENEALINDIHSGADVPRAGETDA